MYGRALALGIGLFMASAVQAVPVVDVILQPQMSGPYAPGTTVMVDVLLSRVATGDPLPVRLLQFDTSMSDPALTLALPETHPLLPGDPNDNLSFWWFVRQPPTAVCSDANATDCGQSYFIDDDLGGTPPNVISIAFIGLSENTILEMFIPGDSALSVKLGEIKATMPAANGLFTLDLMNATLDDPDAGGAELHVSHTLPLTVLRAFDDSLGGGTVVLEVAVDECTQLANLDFAALDATEYPCDTSLPRVGNNILRIEFDVPVTAPVAGEIEIRELLDGGAFGPDISASFTITVEGAGNNVLTITEPGTVLTNEMWYAITNTGGWCDAGDFEVDYAVVYGDANGTLLTSATDLSAIRASFTDLGMTPDNSRFDINTVGGISATDLSAARSVFGELVVKPTGHGCSP